MALLEALRTFPEKSDQPLAVIFSPNLFSLSALREIVRYQIFNDNPTDIRIVFEEEQLIICYNELIGIRSLSRKRRKQEIDWIAEKMLHATNIFLKQASLHQEPSANKNPS